MNLKGELVIEVGLRCVQCSKPLEIGRIAKGWRMYTCKSCNTSIETRTITFYISEKEKG